MAPAGHRPALVVVGHLADIARPPAGRFAQRRGQGTEILLDGRLERCPFGGQTRGQVVAGLRLQHRRLDQQPAQPPGEQDADRDAGDTKHASQAARRAGRHPSTVAKDRINPIGEDFTPDVKEVSLTWLRAPSIARSDAPLACSHRWRPSHRCGVGAHSNIGSSLSRKEFL